MRCSYCTLVSQYMELLVLFAALVLACTAVHVAGQPGFLSIDCGREANYGGYKDRYTGIDYVSDVPYVDGGETHRVTSEYESGTDEHYLTLRSFPSGGRNCYALPAESGARYLVRMAFLYGNYDGKNSSQLQFDLHLGTNYWGTTSLGSESLATVYEAVFVAWASWVPVCLVKTGQSTPFVSSVELRRLEDSTYPQVTADHSMSMYDRRNMGADTEIRYPDDPNDRFWWTGINSNWANISTKANIDVSKSKYAVPVKVLQRAVTTVGNGTVINVAWNDYRRSLKFMVLLHFADFQNSRLRQFNISVNDQSLNMYSPLYLTSSGPYTDWFNATDSKFAITLTATATSVLPPMLNAYEIYIIINHSMPTTFSKDFDAIMAIKLEYGVKKNWMGDPCFPKEYAWDGVKCTIPTGNTTRITSLDLSNSNLNGVISNNFSLLTALEYLNLSGNHLNGPIPDTLCKKNAGSLDFRYESDENMCNKTISPSPSPSPSRNRTAIISISVVVPMLVVAILVLSYFIWRAKRKPRKPVSTHGPSKEPKFQSAPRSRKDNRDDLQSTENRVFTYKELQKFTNKFQQFIGKGGFGPVYYGRLEDDTEVAVKMRSESSSHGLDEFLAEVQSLTKVHHRNLVSLVGYCWEKNHLALVYEYMSRGNLCEHLRGKSGVAKTLNWGTRVRVALEAAQGLDYLHKGCILPIIHRDVKTSNILLGENLQAKIADFGLCKTYLSDTQTHISTNAAGSAGYFDPEYYHTGRLTESSDVYSFGIVLLEIVTGEPPILPSHGHIVQRVKQKIATGNISSVTDARLGSDYEVSSMWKVVDTAMACTADDAVRRPTMAAVVVQLRESLALEEAREDTGLRGSRSDSASLGSTFGPSAR